MSTNHRDGHTGDAFDAARIQGVLLNVAAAAIGLTSLVLPGVGYAHGPVPASLFVAGVAAVVLSQFGVAVALIRHLRRRARVS